MDRWDVLSGAAERLAECLARTGTRLVLAESCTGGLACAALAMVPGVSRWLCGCAVTYREATKTAWLGVSAEELERFTAVSREVADQMAQGVLRRTPEADWAASITGHLGPGAPDGLDGTVWIGVAGRVGVAVRGLGPSRHLLGERERVPRQREAAALLLQRVLSVLDPPGASPSSACY
jgi:nicotinamide-nucleotide amidase